MFAGLVSRVLSSMPASRRLPAPSSVALTDAYTSCHCLVCPLSPASLPFTPGLASCCLPPARYAVPVYLSPTKNPGCCLRAPVWPRKTLPGEGQKGHVFHFSSQPIPPPTRSLFGSVALHRCVLTFGGGYRKERGRTGRSFSVVSLPERGKRYPLLPGRSSAGMPLGSACPYDVLVGGFCTLHVSVMFSHLRPPAQLAFAPAAVASVTFA